MKKVVVISTMFLLSCVSNHHPKDRDPQSETTYKAETVQLYEKLNEKIAESIEWRAKSEEFIKLILDDKQKNTPFTAQQTDDFFAQARKYVKLRQELFGITRAFLFLVEKNTNSKIALNEPTSKTPIRETLYTLNPKDQEGRELLFGLRVSLTAALILYDNFLTGIQPHYESSISRKKLKGDAADEFKHTFTEIITSFFDLEQRRELARAMNLFLTDFNSRGQYNITVSEAESKLNNQILNSMFFNYMLKQGVVKVAWSDKFAVQAINAKDNASLLKDSVLFGVSFAFGNIAGSVSTENRKGYMLSLSQAKREEIKSKLKPFDILLEKTPFKLTDKAIPGYYGHVAVYLGTKAQLQAEGLWDLLKSKPEMQKRIEEGNTILEALRYDDSVKLDIKNLKKTIKGKMQGVQLNSLDHFLNIDEMLVIRKRNEITPEQKQTYMVNSIEQYGKEYDFNFDVQTKNKIVCSELAYVVFTDIDWPNQKQVGRFTISPDHVMVMAFPGKPFKPVLIFDKNRTMKQESDGKDLSLELFRNIQADYMDMIYEENTVFRQTTDPQEITHIASGIAGLQKRLDMIRGATDTIDMEYFIFKTETDEASRIITQELAKKAKEESKVRPGEKINIRLLVDSSVTVLKFKNAYSTLLNELGIKVRYYNQSPLKEFKKANLRNHRKTLVVDGREAITGGRNIASEYFDLSPDYNFLDSDLYIKGNMAKTMKDSFETYWYSPMSAEPDYLIDHSKAGKPDKEFQEKLAKAQNMLLESENDRGYYKLLNATGREMLAMQFTTTCTDSTFVSDLPGDTKDSRRVLKTIMSTVSKARKSLSIESPYFVITDRATNLFNELLEIPGFELNIQTNSLKSTDATYTVAHFYPIIKEWTSRLDAKGKQIVNMWIYKGDKPNYQSVPDFKPTPDWGIHSKRAVIDEETTLIGTFNVDPRSSDLNSEMIFICAQNPQLAADVLKDMKHRRNQSSHLGVNGLPDDGTDLYEGNGRQILEFLIFKNLVRLKSAEDYL